MIITLYLYIDHFRIICQTIGVLQDLSSDNVNIL